MEKICSKPSSSSQESSRWSELPLDMLALIANKLSPTSDYLIFSSVCRSWRSASGKSNYPLSRQMPWLMLPEDNPNSATRRFFSPSEHTIYKLELPEARSTQCVGSTDGWLVIVTENLQVRMLNPMSRHHVSLPPLSCVRAVHGIEGTATSQKFVMQMDKVCLSPGAPRACMAMAIYRHNKVAIAWPGDDTWMDVDSNFWPFVDVVYFDGAFHVVNFEGYVVSCDISGRSTEVSIVANPVSNRFLGWTKYLVESSGDLLQVLQSAKFDVFTNKTIIFKVFRWKPERQEWEEVRNLVDRAIFLGYNSALSVSASAASGCRPNCIYYTYDADGIGGRYMQAYNLEDESIVQPCTILMNYLPIWIQPTLWPAIAKAPTTNKN